MKRKHRLKNLRWMLLLSIAATACSHSSDDPNNSERNEESVINDTIKKPEKPDKLIVLSGLEYLPEKRDDSVSVFRLSYADVFCDTIVMIELSKRNRLKPELTMAALFLGERADGTYWGKDSLLFKKTISVPTERWDSLNRIIEGMLFWEIGEVDQFYFDPDCFVIEGYCGTNSTYCEGVNRGQYHIVSRSFPKNGSFRTSAEYLLEMGKVYFGKEYCRLLPVE